MGDTETLTIFPTSEYEALGDTIFAFLLSYEPGEIVEPRVVFDPDVLDHDEAEEVAMEILDILQKRNIIIPQHPTLN